MRGPKPSTPIQLTQEEAARLQRLIRAHTTGQGLVVRAQMVMMAHEHPDWSNQQLAQSRAYQRPYGAQMAPTVGPNPLPRRCPALRRATAFFPLKYAPRRPPSPVVCHAKRPCRWRAGVERNWLVA